MNIKDIGFLSSLSLIPAATLLSTANGSSVDLRGNGKFLGQAKVLLDVGAVSGTTPTLAVTLQDSPDNTTFTNLANNGSNVPSATGGSCSFATSVMTCTVAPTVGAFAVGQLVNAAGVQPGTIITSLGTGTGGLGTYNLSTAPGTLAAASTTAGSAFAGYTTISGLQDIVLDVDACQRYLRAVYTLTGTTPNYVVSMRLVGVKQSFPTFP